MDGHMYLCIFLQFLDIHGPDPDHDVDPFRGLLVPVLPQRRQLGLILL